jgi:hypothetical protein
MFSNVIKGEKYVEAAVLDTCHISETTRRFRKKYIPFESA